MMRIHSKKGSAGLTLLELMITLAILGILAAVAVPSMMDTMGRMAVNSATRTVSNTLSLARSEAVKRGQNVSVCPSTSGTDCTAASWSSGWIVFVDNNGDANGAVGSIDAGDTIIRVYEPLADMTLTPAATANLLTYDNKGYGTMSAMVTFTLCPTDGTDANGKMIEISLSGRARVIGTGAVCP